MDTRPDWPAWTAALAAVAARVTAAGTCPCAWPRIRQVLEFRFQPYGSAPVLCRETEHLHQRLFSDGAVFERLRDPGGPGAFAGILRCRRCGSPVLQGWEEYSISLQSSVCAWAALPVDTHGAPQARPVPLYGGLAGHCRDFTPFRADWGQVREVAVMRDWLLAEAG